MVRKAYADGAVCNHKQVLFSTVGLEVDERTHLANRSHWQESQEWP